MDRRRALTGRHLYNDERGGEFGLLTHGNTRFLTSDLNLTLVAGEEMVVGGIMKHHLYNARDERRG